MDVRPAFFSLEVRLYRVFVSSWIISSESREAIVLITLELSVVITSAVEEWMKRRRLCRTSDYILPSHLDNVELGWL
jgi:hypothetical protein